MPGNDAISLVDQNGIGETESPNAICYLAELLSGMRTNVLLIGPELSNRHHDNLWCSHVGSIRSNEANLINIFRAFAPTAIQVKMWQG